MQNKYLFSLIAFSLFFTFPFTDANADKTQTQKKAVSYDMSEESLLRGFSKLSILKSGDAILAYNAITSKVINKKRSELKKSHPLFMYDDALESKDKLLLQTTLGKNESNKYYVAFTEGPSGDPAFYLIKQESPNKVWAELSGTALVLPSNDYVYIANRFNNTFTQRKKYSYLQTGLTQINQPYYYVGLKTQTLKPVTLYADQGETKVVAKLPKKSKIEILLTDGKRDKQYRTSFLAATPFGLVGWIWVSQSQYFSNEVEGISYWGD